MIKPLLGKITSRGEFFMGRGLFYAYRITGNGVYFTIQFMIMLIIISFSVGCDSAIMMVSAAKVWSAMLFSVLASSRNSAPYNEP
jgi:hypothetical protein